jgi:multimeric flavodoxin WrbA
MKILAIIGSPRRANTYNSVNLIEAQFKRIIPEAEFEYLMLQEKNLSRCIGCHTCIMKDELKCPFRKEMAEIEEKMSKADGIIFASPVYCMQISSLLKNFFDRLAYVWHRPKFLGKKVMVVCNGAGAGPVSKPVLDYMELNCKRWGMETNGRISLMRLDTKLSKKMQKNFEKMLERETDKFIDSIKSKEKYCPSISDLFWFRIWRNSAKLGKIDKNPDYLYWKNKGWLSKKVNFFYPVSINPIKLGLINLADYAIQKFAASLVEK